MINTKEFPSFLSRNPPKNYIARQSFLSTPIFQLSFLISKENKEIKNLVVIPYSSLLLQVNFLFIIYCTSFFQNYAQNK